MWFIFPQLRPELLAEGSVYGNFSREEQSPISRAVLKQPLLRSIARDTNLGERIRTNAFILTQPASNVDEPNLTPHIVSTFQIKRIRVRTHKSVGTNVVA